MIISIGGPAGSGKSSVAQKLADKLGWSRYYIGGIRRQKAKSLGLTLAEYNKLGETDPTTDLVVDEYQKKLGQTQDNFIIEGRTSWHFIPHSFKIYLDVDEKVGAKRILKEDLNLRTITDVLRSHRQRKKSDTKRYKKYFNIDVYDHNNYDLIIDTSKLSIDETVNKLYKIIKKKL